MGLSGVCMFTGGSPNDREAGFLNPFPDTGRSLLPADVKATKQLEHKRKSV